MTLADRLGRARALVLDLFGRPWVFWGSGALLVGSSFAARQGAPWWVALPVGVVVGLIVAVVIWSLRDAEFRRLRSNRPVRALVAHLRGERGVGSPPGHDPDERG